MFLLLQIFTQEFKGIVHPQNEHWVSISLVVLHFIGFFHWQNIF